MRKIPLLLAALLFAACGDKDSVEDSGAAADDTSASSDDTSATTDDTGTADDTGSDDTGDTSPDDTGETGDTGDTDPPATECADGTPILSFDASGGSGQYDQPIGDFTVATLDGNWTLSDHWTGCDSYVFMNHYDSGGYTYSLAWFDSDMGDFLETSPDNVHWFFSSYEQSADAILDDVEFIQEKIEAELAGLPAAEAAAWRERIHYVTESAWYLGGGIGDALQNVYSTFHVGVDRFQNLREVGYMGDPATGWATAPLYFAAFDPVLYNFEAQRAVELDAQGATIIRAFDAEYISDTSWAGVRGSADVTFPDAATMATFDTLELDLTLACDTPHSDNCAEWDYLVYAYLCDADDSESCGTEFGRWITAYAKPGRWVVDASQFLPDLAEGGERRIEFYTTQGYTVTLDVRLYDSGAGDFPVGAEYLWGGGTFSATYNDSREAISFTPPADASKVELYAVVSGHGYGSDDNYCAEFCDHEHEFTVNGAASYTKSHPEASSAYGCTDTVKDGTIPGQYGTWVYGRGGWCPGLEVQPWVIDLTGDVTMGAENTISYRGLFAGSDPPDDSTDAYIRLTTYLVYSK